MKKKNSNQCNNWTAGENIVAEIQIKFNTSIIQNADAQLSLTNNVNWKIPQIIKQH